MNPKHLLYPLALHIRYPNACLAVYAVSNHPRTRALLRADSKERGRHPEAFHLQVQTASREPERAGRFRDVTGGALERALDHLALQLLDGGRESRARLASRFGGRVHAVEGDAEHRREQLRRDQTARLAPWRPPR